MVHKYNCTQKDLLVDIVEELDKRIKETIQEESKLKEPKDYPLWLQLKERKETYESLKKYIESLYVVSEEHPAYEYTRSGFRKNKRKS